MDLTATTNCSIKSNSFAAILNVILLCFGDINQIFVQKCCSK